MKCFVKKRSQGVVNYRNDIGMSFSMTKRKTKLVTLLGVAALATIAISTTAMADECTYQHEVVEVSIEEVAEAVYMPKITEYVEFSPFRCTGWDGNGSVWNPPPPPTNTTGNRGTLTDTGVQGGWCLTWGDKWLH